LKYALELTTDPWEQIHSEITEVIVAESTPHLDDVSTFYGTPKQHYCMVLGNVLNCHVICAHIWPKFTNGNGLGLMELKRTDVNSPRNFLRLHKSIESAFDKKRLIFLRDMEGNLFVSILDPKLLSEEFEANNCKFAFGSIDNLRFDYKFTDQVKPFMRLLAVHAVKALEKAQLLGWVEAGDFPARRERALELARLSIDPKRLNI
jgi:hypothetical protein